MRVIQADFSERDSLWVTHGSHDALLVHEIVLLGKMGVAPEGTPHILVLEKPFPDGFLLRDLWVAEVGYATLKFCRETAGVFLPEALEASVKAQLTKQHIQVTVGINEAQWLGVRQPGRL